MPAFKKFPAGSCLMAAKRGLQPRRVFPGGGVTSYLKYHAALSVSSSCAKPKPFANYSAVNRRVRVYSVFHPKRLSEQRCRT